MASQSLSNLQRDTDANIAPSNEAAGPRLSYKLPPTSKRLISERRKVQLSSNQGNSVSVAAGQTAQSSWYISGSNFLDPHTVMLTGSLQVTPSDNADRPYCSAGMFGFIDRVVLSGFGGEIISDIPDFGVLAAAMYRSSCDSAWIQTSGTEFLLPSRDYVDRGVTAAAATDEVKGEVAYTTTAGTLAQVNNLLSNIFPQAYADRQTKRWFNYNATSGNSYSFCLPLYTMIPLLRQIRYLPINQMKRLELTIYWAKPRSALTCATAEPSYQISNLALKFDTVRLNDMLMSVINQKVEQDGLRIPYSDFHRTIAPLGTANNATITVSKSCADASGVFMLLRNSADVDAITGDNFFFRSGASTTTTTPIVGVATQYSKPNAISFFCQAGQQRIPDTPIDTIPHAMASLQMCLGHYGDVTHSTTSFDAFGSNGCAVYALDFCQDPFSLSGMSFTGLSLQQGQNLQLVLSNLNNTDKQALVFLEFSKVLVIKPDGQLAIEE